MKTLAFSIVVLLSFVAFADGQSMAAWMEEADLVVAGELADHRADGRFETYALRNAEVIRGEPAGSDFRVCLFTDLCCHVQLHGGLTALLFLHRMRGDVAGLNEAGPVYAVLQGELGHIHFDEGSGPALLEAAREHARLLTLEEEGARAAAMARIFHRAVEADCEPLLFSAAHDILATPGALALVDASTAEQVLARFEAVQPAGRLRHRLLLLLGDLNPPGFAARIEGLVRSVEGRYFLDSCAAMMAVLGEGDAAGRLAHEFDSLDPVAQENVLYVLGRMKGRGMGTLVQLAGEKVHTHGAALVEALRADRSDAAVGLLGEIALAADQKTASAALEALAAVNTREARSQFLAVSESPLVQDALREKAAALLEGLAR